MRRLTWLLVVAACHATPAPSPTGPSDYAATCHAIAEDIEDLARHYPQLAAFTVTRVMKRQCTIDYEYHTHKPEQRGGWSSGVPHPDPDGIWLFINVWDPDDPSDRYAELHTQPMTFERRHLGKREVTVFVAEGDHTTPVADHIHAILKARGVVTRR
jgi:hypothetical protein